MRLRKALLLLLASLVLVLVYRFAPDLARAYVFRTVTDEDSNRHPSTTRAQQVVRASLPAAGLTEAGLVDEGWEDRSDQSGSWKVYRAAWRLPAGQAPEEVARRISSLIEGGLPQSEVYSVRSETGDVEVRIYHESRLAAFLRVEPELVEWPVMSGNAAPLLALVLLGIDESPQSVQALLDLNFPFAFALSPYSPFTLRVARDAVLAHKEVLVVAEEGQTPTESIQTVPHASGVVFTSHPGGQASQQAKRLADQGLYVIDLIPDGLTAAWLRALRDANVPFIRGQRYDQANAPLMIKRMRHGAVQTGTATLAVNVMDAQQSDVLGCIQMSATRGYRIAFPAEIAQHWDSRD